MEGPQGAMNPPPKSGEEENAPNLQASTGIKWFPPGSESRVRAGPTYEVPLSVGDVAAGVCLLHLEVQGPATVGPGPELQRALLHVEREPAHVDIAGALEDACVGDRRRQNTRLCVRMRARILHLTHMGYAWCYSAFAMMDMLLFATTWVTPEGLMLSETKTNTVGYRLCMEFEKQKLNSWKQRVAWWLPGYTMTKCEGFNVQYGDFG